MFADGQKVAFIGSPGNGPEIGDEGIIVDAGSTSGHVRWTTGAQTGEIHLVAYRALVAAAKAPTTVDTFGESLLGFSPRSVYASKGASGLLNRMNREGHLVGFEEIAEDVLGLVVGRVREDPSVKEATAGLDDDVVADFVHLAAVTILRDAFGAE
jgi:hypothetical protein